MDSNSLSNNFKSKLLKLNVPVTKKGKTYTSFGGFYLIKNSIQYTSKTINATDHHHLLPPHWWNKVVARSTTIITVT